MTRRIETISAEELREWPVAVALFDIDGTLVHGTNEIPERVVGELKRIRGQGIKVCLATGRPFFSARWVAERIGSDEPGMFCSGSLVCRPLSGEVLLADYLKPAQTLRFVEHMRREGFYLELYTKDSYFIDAATDFSRAHEKYMNVAAVEEPLDLVAQREDLLKFVIMVRRGEREQRLRQIMLEYPEYSAGISGGEADPDILFFNLTNQTASRARAFEFFLSHYGISRDAVAAFGDAESDMAFLSSARYGVAMSNASDMIRKCASFFTGDVRSGGVADALAILVPSL